MLSWSLLGTRGAESEIVEVSEEEIHRTSVSVFRG